MCNIFAFLCKTIASKQFNNLSINISAFLLDGKQAVEEIAAHGRVVQQITPQAEIEMKKLKTRRERKYFMEI